MAEAQHYQDTTPTQDPPPRGQALTWCGRVVPVAEVTTIRRRVGCPDCKAVAGIK